MPNKCQFKNTQFALVVAD